MAVCFFVGVGRQSRRAKCRPHWKNDCVFPIVFEISGEHVQNQLEQKNKLMEVHERSAHAYSATPLDIIQVCILFIFSWFGHPPRKLLKKMGEHTTQPRLENIISKQASAWPLTCLFKPSNICLMQYFFREYNIPSIKPNLSMKWNHCAQPPYIREYSIYLTWMHNHFQRQLCKVPLEK